MPVITHGSLCSGPLRRQIVGRASDRTTSAAAIEIAFFNSMSGGALVNAERQFMQLLTAAAPDVPLRWSKYTLMPLGPLAGDDVDASYQDLATVWRTSPDVVVVTGAEPTAADLRDEPFWSALTQLLTWAEECGAAVMLSCLAAHAAVLHFDGIQRTRLPSKRSGVFDHVRGSVHVLTQDLPAAVRVPHSRWNEIDEGALIECGYDVLTGSPQAGIDMFVRQGRGLMLFCQGHPEYEPMTLLREYRRDVGRYMKGKREDYPDPPENYFDAIATEALSGFRQDALVSRNKDLLAAFPWDLLANRVDTAWHLSATSVLRRWLLRAMEDRHAG